MISNGLSQLVTCQTIELPLKIYCDPWHEHLFQVVRNVSLFNNHGTDIVCRYLLFSILNHRCLLCWLVTTTPAPSVITYPFLSLYLICMYYILYVCHCFEACQRLSINSNMVHNCIFTWKKWLLTLSWRGKGDVVEVTQSKCLTPVHRIGLRTKQCSFRFVGKYYVTSGFYIQNYLNVFCIGIFYCWLLCIFCNDFFYCQNLLLHLQLTHHVDIDKGSSHCLTSGHSFLKAEK